MCWAVKLGGIDIQVEVAMMTQYQTSPRYGHLEAAYVIFHYLSKNPTKRLVLGTEDILNDPLVFNNMTLLKD